MKKLMLLATFAGLVSVPALSQAQRGVVFDGDTFSKFYGSAVAVQDLTQGSPNSGVAESAFLSANTTNGAEVWEGAAFGLTTTTIAPDQVDWTLGDLQFDYKVAGGQTGLFTFDVLFYNPVTTSHTLAARAQYAGGTALISDGEWHTFSADVTGWTQAYLDAAGAGNWNTANPIQWRIYMQAAGEFNDVSIDNITVPLVPEPSTYALVTGALVLGLVMVRRRRN